MPHVALPEKDQLVKDLVEMLSVLNLPEKRAARAAQGSVAVPGSQLDDRARAIAQYIILFPAAPSVMRTCMRCASSNSVEEYCGNCKLQGLVSKMV